MSVNESPYGNGFLDGYDAALADIAVLEAAASVPPEGVALIATERRRQVEAEGWTAEHDAEHAEGDLYEAAIAYLLGIGEPEGMPPPDPWPWGAEWYKPSADPLRTLVKAGALIAAEIDRRLLVPSSQEPTE